MKNLGDRIRKLSPNTIHLLPCGKDQVNHACRIRFNVDYQMFCRAMQTSDRPRELWKNYCKSNGIVKFPQEDRDQTVVAQKSIWPEL